MSCCNTKVTTMRVATTKYNTCNDASCGTKVAQQSYNTKATIAKQQSCSNVCDYKLTKLNQHRVAA
jgi:hypothetical protein